MRQVYGRPVRAALRDCEIRPWQMFLRQVNRRPRRP